MSEQAVLAPIDEHETRLERERYDRIAWAYDLGEWPMEFFIYAGMRAHLFAGVEAGQQMLEVGIGTGHNLSYYPVGVKARGIDLSPKMLARAEQRAKELGVSVDLEVADAQALPFDDASFDVVVSTFVFCSVPDPVRGLRELGRVCREDGQILLMEHVRPANKLLAALADLVDPIVSRLWGAHINRPTVALVREAGLTVHHEERELGIFRTLYLGPPADRQRSRSR